MESAPAHFVAEEWTEDEWLSAAVRNSTFDFLADSQEDIYSLDDGKPIEVISEKFVDADNR